MTDTEREQYLREQRQVQLGVERYDSNREGSDEGEQGPGRALVLKAVEPLADAIEADAAGKTGRGQPPAWAAYFRALEPYPMAYITARACLSGGCAHDSTPGVAMRIAKMIEEHYRFDELMAAEPDLGNHMKRKAERWTTAAIFRVFLVQT